MNMQAIRSLMDEHDLNQSALARIAGVTDGTVSQWFSGDRFPPLKRLQLIADYFGVPLDYLTGRPSYEYAYLKLSPNAPKKAYAPLLGRVHAGDRSELDILDEAVPVPFEIWERHQDAILLAVEGDCMDKVLPPGCLVLVDRNQERV